MRSFDLRYVVIFMIIALMILHQDFWWWYDIEPLVFGFIPIGLAYHGGISLVSTVAWAMAIKFCWPDHVDEVEEELQAVPGAH